MNNIKIMDEILSNKIAAGEVVEKCVSVVKELVENSIDAGSKKIKIELLESGVKEIKVVDDGKGMDYEDASLAFQRHATSKIYDEEDLYRIHSLGFRGEALPSIASISNVVMKTSTGDIGTEINIKGGKEVYKKKCEARKGTIIIINDLFYNTPARLKHLSSLYSELANVVEFVNKIALSYPSISFTLLNDNKVIFNTDGSNNQLKVINKIYGLEISKKMIEINGSNDDYEINGYICYPEITKSNRNHIITLVNNRVVKNIELNRVINDCYHTYKPEDRYPIVVINIYVDPTLIDVNIHPTKQDIKFSKMDQLKEIIISSIEEGLSSIRLIPKVENREVEKATLYEEIRMDFGSVNEEVEEENIDVSSDKLPELYPVGVVRGTYIVCQNDMGMYLIDQHAAKERVNYEYYKKVIGKSNDVTSMLFPINIELPYNEYIIVKENINIFESLGFTVEDFGQNTLIFRSHPIWLPIGNEEEAIKKILDLIVVKEKEFNIDRFNERIAITLSCKMSIKANENISFKEMESLIQQLNSCSNPYTCPHGRPTVIFYSYYEIEKLFKRVV
ncbi:MAG: DNA mismatch repair endonuclease MutL [Bacilli bacterium]|nr:DNA mismatch repair endonuclease MutL [Bacilli bacterium]